MNNIIHAMVLCRSHNLHSLIILLAYFFRSAQSIFDFNNNDEFDWLNGDDDDDFEDFSPVRVEDEHLAGKMYTFFEKLNSMRRSHHELKLRRQSDHLQPFLGGSSTYVIIRIRLLRFTKFQKSILLI